MSNPVIIHPHPDLDAVVCCTLAGATPADTHFLPAGEKTLPERCPCCDSLLGADVRILDHPLGEKGRLDPDGVRHAAAAAMPEAADADPDLLAEVDEQDSTGKVERPRFPLARILAAIRAEAKERGLNEAALDRETVAAMSRVVRGINLVYAARRRARQEAAAARIVPIGSFRVAVLPAGQSLTETGIVLNEEHDVSAAIYRSGHNLGVNRYPGRSVPDLRLLEPHLPGWFVHSAGFLAGWGSLKSPATTSPPQGTPHDQAELLALLNRVFTPTS